MNCFLEVIQIGLASILIIASMMQVKDYGSCVAAKVPEVERDMCLKEFLALKNCMQNVVLFTITDKGYVLGCNMMERTYS